MFPHPETAGPEGLLAIGGDLSPERLLLAYRFGIFPWYNEGPILWWSPDPRCVLKPAHVYVSKSMRQFMRKSHLKASINMRFAEVMRSCKDIDRQEQEGTWITAQMQSAYQNLHDLGYAHSIEVWEDNVVVAGLYGIALGRIFYGESMFTRIPNASKFALIKLCRFLEKEGFLLIDCQQDTDHLRSLGAVTIPRPAFLKALRKNNLLPEPHRSWRGPIK
ncbi:MAG: leucyl/phenylalanyl-tRNA--protein transferase [Saprospiraceae bacterium]|nr:leucyl/phenylalanyl-tRNA--protein transferase [Saprospiraceae bacterium]